MAREGKSKGMQIDNTDPLASIADGEQLQNNSWKTPQGKIYERKQQLCLVLPFLVCVLMT